LSISASKWEVGFSKKKERGKLLGRPSQNSKTKKREAGAQTTGQGLKKRL